MATAVRWRLRSSRPRARRWRTTSSRRARRACTRPSSAPDDAAGTSSRRATRGILGARFEPRPRRGRIVSLVARTAACRLPVRRAHRPRARASRASAFAALLVRAFGLETLRAGAGVVDVAGGSGELALELVTRWAVPCCVVDPRGDGAKITARHRRLLASRERNAALVSDAWKAESALARSLARRWTAVPDPHRAIRHLKRAFDERIVAAAAAPSSEAADSSVDDPGPDGLALMRTVPRRRDAPGPGRGRTVDAALRFTSLRRRAVLCSRTGSRSEPSRAATNRRNRASARNARSRADDGGARATPRPPTDARDADQNRARGGAADGRREPRGVVRRERRGGGRRGRDEGFPVAGGAEGGPGETPANGARAVPSVA